MMKRFAKIVDGCNYSQYFFFGIFLKAGLVFTPEVVIQYEKLWRRRGPGERIFDIPIEIFKQICLFAANLL